MFHFEIRHVAGKTFGPDGLSRRYEQPGDEKYPEDEDSGENNPPPNVILTDGVPVPLVSRMKSIQGVVIVRCWHCRCSVFIRSWEGQKEIVSWKKQWSGTVLIKRFQDIGMERC